MDAFISHASKDATLAARIEELLEEDGLKVWDPSRVFVARAGLLTYCEAVLEGRENGSRGIIGPQLAAAFSD